MSIRFLLWAKLLSSWVISEAQGLVRGERCQARQTLARVADILDLARLLPLPNRQARPRHIIREGVALEACLVHLLVTHLLRAPLRVRLVLRDSRVCPKPQVDMRPTTQPRLLLNSRIITRAVMADMHRLQGRPLLVDMVVMHPLLALLVRHHLVIGRVVLLPLVPQEATLLKAAIILSTVEVADSGNLSLNEKARSLDLCNNFTVLPSFLD